MENDFMKRLVPCSEEQWDMILDEVFKEPKGITWGRVIVMYATIVVICGKIRDKETKYLAAVLYESALEAKIKVWFERNGGWAALEKIMVPKTPGLFEVLGEAIRTSWSSRFFGLY